MATDGTPGRDLVEHNRRHWDERVPIHLRSAFYDVDGYLAGNDDFDEYQLDEIGDVTGLDLVHLQCHVGQDTLSWARRGARHVTGLDFSAPAIDAAIDLADQLGLNERAHFVTAEVLDAARVLGDNRFDIVYTGHGALMWVPDIHAWAATVAALLRPGGRLYLTEFHPLTDVLDDEHGTRAQRDYFTRGARTYDSPGTYADWNAATTHNTATEWHHTLGDILTAIASAGLKIDFVHERDSIPFQRYTALILDQGRFRYPEGTPRLPLMYSIGATAA
ncbi:class I SAM-dependent methyltransferase [Pseudonocardia alni]|uniref:class I SAM-dependent methyltransferase n=1 Tax=Pseudonocardia alni TaxID=33907 RepID=UPI00340F6A0E